MQKHEHNYAEEIYTNVKTLLKLQDKSIGTLEKELNLSSGYLSRRCNYNINVVYDISKSLGVSIEDLIEKDYSYEAKKHDLEQSVQALKEQLRLAQHQLEDLEKNNG